MENTMKKAIEQLNIKKISEILEGGFDVNKQYFTPNYMPESRNKLNSMEYLFEVIHGKKQLRDSRLGIALARAQGAKCREIAKLFMKDNKLDLQYHNNYYETYLDMLIILLTRETSQFKQVVDIFTEHGMFMIIDLIQYGKDSSSNIINRQAENGDGMTPFHRIIDRGQILDLRCFGTGDGYTRFTKGKNTSISYYDLVQHFILNGAKVDLPVLPTSYRKIKPIVNGLYPIHLASRICNNVSPEEKKSGIIPLLLENGADLFQKSLKVEGQVYNKTAMHFACDPYYDSINDYIIVPKDRISGMKNRIEHCEENIKFLIDKESEFFNKATSKEDYLKSNINAVDSENYTPLMRASQQIFFPEEVFIMILKGRKEYNPDVFPRGTEVQFNSESIEGMWSAGVIERVIDDGKEYEVIDNTVFPPVTHQVLAENVRIPETYITSTALDIQDSSKNTALFILLLHLPIKTKFINFNTHWQSVRRRNKVIELLRYGANTSLKNKDEMTALDIAIKQNEENSLVSLSLLERNHDSLKNIQEYLVRRIRYFTIDETLIDYREVVEIDGSKTITPEQVIFDPITLDEKTVQQILNEQLDNIIFCDENMRSFTYIARQNFIKTLGMSSYGNGSSIKFQCKQGLASDILNVTFDDVIDPAYVDFSKIGLSGQATGVLVNLHEFTKKILLSPVRSSSQNVIFMITNSKEKIKPLADMQIITDEIDPELGRLNSFSETVDIIGASHCQNGSEGTLGSIKIISVKKEDPSAGPGQPSAGQPSAGQPSAGPGQPTAREMAAKAAITRANKPKSSGGTRKKN